MSAVKLSQLTKYFGDKLAVDSIDLDIAEGEFVSLLGPSGCGKTTILRMISGLESPSQGHIFFNDRDITQATVVQRHVGMVFQRFALFPHMTVEKNVSFGLRMAGLDAESVRALTTEMLEVVQLQAERQRYPAQLSGGQMQRVALARTLITEPSVLLMDEPFSSLDQHLRQDMRQFLLELQRRLKITTILVTHDQQEAMELSDRIAVIFGGKLAQVGTPDALYRQPHSADVARFMGRTNVIQTYLQGDGQFMTPFGTLIYNRNTPVKTTEVTFSIRPEHVKISLIHAVDTPPLNSFTGFIHTQRYAGSVAELCVKIGETSVLAMVLAPQALAVGTAVHVVFPAEHLWPISDSIR